MDDPFTDLTSRVLAADSMTEALRRWCETHGIGQGALRSDHAPGSGLRPLPVEAVAALGLAPGETTRHRGIALMRGDAGLLDADNWYVPERLPAAINDRLRDTDIPFGAALPREGQTRRTLYCGPPPDRSGAAGEAWRPPDPARPILTIRALVLLDGRPVSFVEERLRPQLLSGRASPAGQCAVREGGAAAGRGGL